MPTDDPHEDALVTYSVRELLSDIKTAQTTAFASLETSLKSKADKADFARMETRLDAHGERLSTLEQERRDKQITDNAAQTTQLTRWTRRNKIIATAVSVLMILATIAGPYIGSSIH